MKLLVVVEETTTGYSAYAPDLPGCVATGRSKAEVEQRMHDALQLHLDALQADGNAFSAPHTYVTTIEAGG